MRSLAVIVFIGLVGAIGIYFAQRPTIARGDVVASDLLQSNAFVKSLECQQAIPITVSGATFACRAEFKSGDVADYTFALDRAGSITMIAEENKRSAPVIKKTSDPWGD